MSFADQDEPSRPRRRKGAKRGQKDAGFDDFWTRETPAVRGRGRRRGPGDDADPADVSDLTGPPPAASTRSSRGRAGDAPGRQTPPDAGRDRRTPSAPAAPAPAPRGRRGGPAGPPAAPAGPPPGRGVAPAGPPTVRGRAVAPSRGAAPAPGPVGGPPPAGGPRGRTAGRPGEGYPAYGGAGPVPAPRPAARGNRPGRAPAPRGGADWYDDAATGAWERPPAGDGARRPGGPAPRSGSYPGGAYSAGPAAGPAATGGYAAPPWAQEPAPRRARLESTSSYHLASTLADDGYGDDVYFDDDEELDEPELPEELPKRRGCRTALLVLLVLVLGVAAAGFFGWRWLQVQLDPPGGQGAQVLVEVPEGTSTAAIGKLLERDGVITNASVWSWYTKLKDVGSFQAGSYQLRRNSSFDEVVHDLAADPLPPHTRMVTVPEGYTLTQTLARLGDKDKGIPTFTPVALRAAVSAPTSRSKYLPATATTIEGTLFPDSYAVGDKDNEMLVMGRMVAQFDKTMDGLGAKAKAAQLKVTPYQALIVASLIEKEARVPEDRPKVARVIYNRLAAGQRLGVDAALCYGKGEVPCKLTQSDLDTDTPYNTRLRAGLPPTPIASPGKASIAAALAPAAGNWTYYVLADAEGHHAFTNSPTEFNRLKAECKAKGLGCG